METILEDKVHEMATALSILITDIDDVDPSSNASITARLHAMRSINKQLVVIEAGLRSLVTVENVYADVNSLDNEWRPS